mgnify:CR=1 FL=1
MKRLLLFLMSSLLLTGGAWAFPAAKTPEVVVEALEAYKAAGHQGFFNRLVQFGPLKDDPKNQLNGFLHRANSLGFYRDHEVVRCQALSNRVTRTYLIIHYTEGVLFLRVDSYLPPEGRNVTTTLKWSTDSEAILPFVFTEK